MRKSTKLMVGLGVVAGLGVALAPLATFADPMGSDALTVNVNSDCAIAEDGSSNQILIDGEWEGTGVPGDNVTLTGPGTGGVAAVTFECSENSKVTIAATAADLSNGSDTIEADQITAYYTGANGMTIVAAYADSSNYGALADTATTVANGTAVSTGDLTFTVAGYKAQLKADQEPGVYEGDITYTFALVNE